MALGYETYDDDRDFEQTGLTGDVLRYSIQHMKFPCYVLCQSKENVIDAYKVELLKRMLVHPNGQTLNEEELSSGIEIYYTEGGQTARFGKILPKQVKPFLKLFEGNIIEGYYTKDKKLTEDYLYVLAE